MGLWKNLISGGFQSLKIIVLVGCSLNLINTSFLGDIRMKKSIIALAILGTVSGVATAATNVALYGRVDVGYTDTTKEGESVSQSGGGETRLGVRGEEDLGNGLAATFQMEGRFDADTGSKTEGKSFFDRESTVGLKGAFGHVRFGRSTSSMERGLGFVNIGRRIHDVSPYASVARHSNAAFYDYTNGTFSVGGDITTKGGYDDSIIVANEGKDDTKVGYGVYGKYSANGFTAGLAYQADSVETVKKIAKEYGLGLSYNFNPITVGASYARGEDDVTGSTAKSRIWHAFISGTITPNDTLAAIYHNDKRKQTVGNTTSTYNNTQSYGLEYVHSLSKRTSVYADVKRVSDKLSDKDYTAWDIALRHNF